jgi:hypothetical protein
VRGSSTRGLGRTQAKFGSLTRLPANALGISISPQTSKIKFDRFEGLGAHPRIAFER